MSIFKSPVIVPTVVILLAFPRWLACRHSFPGSFQEVTDSLRDVLGSAPITETLEATQALESVISEAEVMHALNLEHCTL